MASKRAQRRKTCTGKVRHATQDAAIEALVNELTSAIAEATAFFTPIGVPPAFSERKKSGAPSWELKRSMRSCRSCDGVSPSRYS